MKDATMDGAAHEARGDTGSARCRRRRRRHRRCRQSMPAVWTVTASGGDNTGPVVDAGYLELVPLALEPRMGSVTPNPMLEEFIISHHEVCPLLETSSPATVAQITIDPPLSSPVQGMRPQTGPCVVVEQAALAVDPDGHHSPDPSTPTKDA